MRISNNQLRLSASDVSNFLACRYLTHLDLLKAKRLLAPPQAFDIGFMDIVKRGEEHEANVLAGLCAAGHTVVEIADNPNAPAAAVEQTRSEVEAGRADVIYQGVLSRPATGSEAELYGRPDFLVRAGLLDGAGAASERGGYEVVDAKLARSAKARAILQITFYSALLADLQGHAPKLMHLALGDGEFVPFDVGDFAAYERQTRRLLQELVDTAEAAQQIAPPSDPYPEPVEHCAICRWSGYCGPKRRTDDDLSLVANMPARQRRGVKGRGVETRRGFAGMGELPVLEHGSALSLADSHLQAQLQVRSEDEGVTRHELLEPERDGDGNLMADRGLLALPEPAEGDLFFDIEGARYWSEDGKEFGLQYLFGIVDTADLDELGRPRYHEIWAFDRPGERRAFEELVDFFTARREAHPDLHVYHYNHYEPTSIDHLTELHQTREELVGRLMGRFATREDEVDDLFRRRVFVDLYRVVRQGVRAGVESYSIKRLEPMIGFDRQVDLGDATANLIAFEASLDEGTAGSDTGHRSVVAGYNEDDCRATLALRDWLEDRRSELEARLGEALPRPCPSEAEDDVEPSDAAVLREALLATLPSDRAVWSDEDGAKALLADLLEWHRREAKPAWWRFFRLHELSDAELVVEPDALGMLTGGEVVATEKQSNILRFRFPSQEHRLSAGETAVDPATGKSWNVWSVHDDVSEIELKIGKSNKRGLPTSLIPSGPPKTPDHAARLLELGRRALSSGGLDGSNAADALLLRRRPSGTGGSLVPLVRGGETSGAAAVRLCLSLHRSYLPIQGPPGTGKTYTGAEQILALVREGRRVGITGPSHHVISNLIDEVYKHAAETGETVTVAQRCEKDYTGRHPSTSCCDSNEKLVKAMESGEYQLFGGTTWLWARQELQASVDTLFVDEAGQLSLANVVAVAGAATNLVLLGDPQQLAQPSQAAHPPGAGVSALEHILGEAATMPADAGLLLEKTWRMHPELCAFTSGTFYDDRLSCVDGLENQSVLGAGVLSGSGVRIVPVAHEHNTNSSPEEADAITSIVSRLLGTAWRDRHGLESALEADDILVVTPYNAQIRTIRTGLAAAGLGGVQVGTVDKFQGREAPVVLYSMASSSATEAPRGMEFLYDLHRLNVATSRARALAILVASPDLIRVFCGTPQQMVLANALCRAWELSGR